MRLAAKQAVFAFMEKQGGEGWWGSNEAPDNCKERGEPFGWVKVHPFIAAEIQSEVPGCHAGKIETSLMMAFCPDCVDMKQQFRKKWYSQSAKEASLEYGNSAKKLILDRMKKILTEK